MIVRIHRGSVLPRIDARRTPDGTLVQALRPTAADMRELFLYGLGFFMVLPIIFLTRGGVLAHVARLMQVGAFFSMFLGLLTTYLRRKRLLRAMLLVSHWPIRLGDTVKVRFRAMLRKSAPVATLTAALRCAEEVTIGGGREQVKRSAAMFELELPCSKQKRQIVEEEWTFTIPPDLPSSFAVMSNRLEWRVDTLLMDVPANFLLLVIPEVAP